MDKRFIQHIKRNQKRVTLHNITDKEALHSTIYRTRRHYKARYTGQKRHYTAQHTGQKRFIQHNILAKQHSTVYLTKLFTQHNIPDKKASHSTIYRTKKHHTAQYTGQKHFILHNISDKSALYSTVYRTKSFRRYIFNVQYTPTAGRRISTLCSVILAIRERKKKRCSLCYRFPLPLSLFVSRPFLALQ